MDEWRQNATYPLSMQTIEMPGHDSPSQMLTHWRKLFTISPADLHARDDRLPKFVEMREEVRSAREISK